MKILFFAASRTLSGIAHEDMILPHTLTTTQLWEQILVRHPALAQIRSTTRLARNGEYEGDTAEFTDLDEVALIPPVSGG